MCGRFVDPNLRSAGLDMTQTKVNPFPRRFNVKPTQDVYALIDGQPALARWGLIPSWHRGELKEWKAATINARIEEARDKPSFRDAWRRGRILIPVGGYYEWTGEKSPKQPHFFQGAGNEETLWFAGLSSIWRDLMTCTIMTRAANDSVEPVHDRMPVILNSDEREAWLAGSEDLSIGAGARVMHHPVHAFGINDEGPLLIEPI
ncbi:SOS response-associated peptidase [Pseudogemmobacter faecipullorum]|uniref:Abasic site processing protein n=1 Tax=Pseudogemmobacter faecipullorum TaxID=2755041 RepID=A0ABS8CS07_9RHOB|nr:SOS response-associated peptidase [Pseudogemmobacter faecipullorum]MCB5412177.1 SOS response-associated peptidase [Pseudogemmobacter faecipullorum]